MQIGLRRRPRRDEDEEATIAAQMKADVFRIIWAVGQLTDGRFGPFYYHCRLPHCFSLFLSQSFIVIVFVAVVVVVSINLSSFPFRFRVYRSLSKETVSQLVLWSGSLGDLCSLGVCIGGVPVLLEAAQRWVYKTEL